MRCVAAFRGCSSQLETRRGASRGPVRRSLQRLRLPAGDSTRCVAACRGCGSQPETRRGASQPSEAAAPSRRLDAVRRSLQRLPAPSWRRGAVRRAARCVAAFGVRAAEGSSEGVGGSPARRPEGSGSRTPPTARSVRVSGKERRALVCGATNWCLYKVVGNEENKGNSFFSSYSNQFKCSSFHSKPLDSISLTYCL